MTDKARKYLFDILEAVQSIDDGVIWGTIKKHLPVLKKEVEEILK
jgi:uncharacterized protein with HEPN domain